MKTLMTLFILVIIIATAIGCSDDSSTGPTKTNSGKIKEERCYIKDYKTDEKTLYYISKYDTNGNETESHYYFRQGVKSIYTYEYDENGKKISGTWKLIDINRTRYGTYTYEYDENGNLIVKTQLDSNASIFHKFIYKYDVNDKLIEYKFYDKYKEEICKAIYKYDQNGNNVEVIYYKDEMIYMIEKYKYDSKGKVIEKNSYRIHDQTLISKCLYKYDILGNLIEKIFYDKEGNIVIGYVYEYSYY